MNDPLFNRIGAERLRAVLVDFYARVFDDAMIGFLFWGKDKARLIDREWQFAARLLGADVEYTGRPIKEAHANSPILGGHFARRLKILEETLADHHVDADVGRAWIEHTRALRGLVTRDTSAECDHDKSAARLAEAPDGPANKTDS